MKILRIVSFYLIAQFALVAEPFRGYNFGASASPFMTIDTLAPKLHSYFGIDQGYQFKKFYFGLAAHFSGYYNVENQIGPRTLVTDIFLPLGWLFDLSDEWKYRVTLGPGVAGRQYYQSGESSPFFTELGGGVTLRNDLMWAFLQTENSSLALGAYVQIAGRFFSRQPSEMGFITGLRLDYHLDFVSLFADLTQIFRK